MSKPITFWVHTTCDHKNVPAGSGICVTKVFKRSYRGEWSFRGYTQTVTVPKAICQREEMATKPRLKPKQRRELERAVLALLNSAYTN